MTEIETLRNMIEDAKKENDEVLIEYLGKALLHLIEKQKTQENIKLKSQENINQEENQIVEQKQELIIEEKKEEKEIEKINSNGKTSLTTYKDGNLSLSSEYMDVKVNSSNRKLKLDLESILVTIALDELNESKGIPPKSITDISNLISQVSTEEELNDIANYLNSVAQVGDFGRKISESLQSAIENRRDKLSSKSNNFDLSIELELDDIQKKIAMADMELDEIRSAKMKNPDDFYALAGKYEKQIKDLESTLEYIEDPKKAFDVKKQIADLKDKIINIRKYAQSIEEIADISFEM